MPYILTNKTLMEKKSKNYYFLEIFSFYTKLERMNLEIEEFYEKEDECKKDSVSSLSWMLLSDCFTRYKSVSNRLESKSKFCTTCLYNNLDVIRKSILRYLSIEQEISEEYKAFFLKIKDSANELCLQFNQMYSLSANAEIGEHNYEKNVALAAILSLKIKAEDDFEDEDYED